MPSTDGSGAATTGYFVNDLVASQEVPGVERASWSLDPLQRFATQATFAYDEFGAPQPLSGAASISTKLGDR
ncbi:hypothetical protein [Cellulomonas phragmiteti]|uniref:Uncharacterized protein n=1 Tax=Cellulomonas phragmiteti TaxID=478780 RepID=A0ABQ4DPH5_9CELL|nr:hypothetical protein [Cellulomonas phragmiteti]GIG41258.1 hypothetical protein Cph01nite_30200 [Cellulomonas phragmiteti]